MNKINIILIILLALILIFLILRIILLKISKKYILKKQNIESNSYDKYLKKTIQAQKFIKSNTQFSMRGEDSNRYDSYYIGDARSMAVGHSHLTFGNSSKLVLSNPAKISRIGNVVDIKDTRNYTAMQINYKGLEAFFT